MSVFDFSVKRIRGSTTLLVGIVMALTACNVPALPDGTNAANGSTGQNTGRISVSKAESFSICPDGSRESGLMLIDDAKSWQAFVKSTTQSAPNLADWRPDFVNSRVVLIRFGGKTSAGYGVRVGEAKWTADSGIVLSVRTSKPQPGSLNASILTSPCLLVNIAQATFKSLIVVDLTEDRSLGQITPQAERSK